VNLARDIAAIGGTKGDAVALPDRVDKEGVRPVWKGGLAGDNAIAKWLTERIGEIDKLKSDKTTITILVNEERQVESLTKHLNALLENSDRSAIPCKDGKVMGSDSDIRVFCIDHIKGLEFEAVFFVNLDHTIGANPYLFAKYLYVGATRAATFLGITFANDIPLEVRPLEKHFVDSWRDP